MDVDPGAALLALEPWKLAGVATLTLLGSVMAGLSGIGGGMLLAMAIAPVVGVKPLVPIISVAMLINHVFRVWVFRAGIQWPTAGLMASVGVPATVCGAMVYVALSAKVVAIVIGVCILVFVPARRLIGHRTWRLGKPGLAGVAGVYGFLSGATLGAGLIVIPALLGHGLTGAMLIGTDAALGLAVIVAKTTTFGTLDVLTPNVLAFGVVMGTVSAPGIYLARWIIEHTTVKVHTLVVEVMIVAGAISILYRGLAG